MKLSLLLKALPESKKYKKDPDIKGISEDSRNIRKDFLFVAISGFTVDGHDFISSAIAKGAKVIVGEKEEKNLVIPEGIIYIKAASARSALGYLSSFFYGQPSKKIKVIGVTGTKGKTTTSHLIYHILNKSGHKTGLISSIKAIIGRKEYDTGFHVTNPDPVTLNQFLKEMVDKNCKFAVLEVSSHGIDQHRIDGIDFYVGVLTNIAPEHLDYHKTFENYKQTKMRFINSARHQVFAPEKTKLDILEGDFNNLNAEAAIKTTEILGVSREKAVKTLGSFTLPEGRMMSVSNKKGFNIIIDFAHNPSSLEAVLSHLRKEKIGRLICIFGCASERDETKRPVMGEISTRLADISVFTAEDPRREDIGKIIKEIAGGIKDKSVKEIDFVKNDFSARKPVAEYPSRHVFIRIPERGDAITYAIQKIAKKGDTVVVCGKGHEKSMSYDGVEYPWSDKKAVELALRGKIFRIKRPNLNPAS